MPPSFNSPFPIRGYLIHLTHYAPSWLGGKAREKSFDLQVAHEVVDALAIQGFNMLLIGVSDGIRYDSHPEFTRRYSVPKEQLVELAEHARACGMEVVPKLNFSRSAINCHNHWMRAPGEEWCKHFDDEYFWKTAFEVIDEVVAACQPERFFHVGMDEDHERSVRQFSRALTTLHAGLRERGLRTVAWSDSALDYPSGEVYREKSEFAEKEGIPKDIVRVLWNYWAVPEKEMQHVHEQGMELWGAPGWSDPDQVVKFRDALSRSGGKGIVMTRWIPCQKRNRKILRDLVQQFGPLYHS
jgi:hypothetical protein